MIGQAARSLAWVGGCVRMCVRLRTLVSPPSPRSQAIGAFGTARIDLRAYRHAACSLSPPFRRSHTLRCDLCVAVGSDPALELPRSRCSMKISAILEVVPSISLVVGLLVGPGCRPDRDVNSASLEAPPAVSAESVAGGRRGSTDNTAAGPSASRRSASTRGAHQ